MNRKLKSVVLGILVLGAVCTFTSCKDYDDDIDDLQEQIDSLSSLQSSEISTVESTLSTLQSTASSLSSEIDGVQDNLDDAVEALEAADDALAAADAELQSAISSNASDIATLQTNVSTLEATVSSLESVVEALQIELASLTASLEQVNAAITTLQAAVETNASAIATNSEKIAALETALTEANAAISAAQDAAAAAATAAANAQSDVDALKVIVESLTTGQSELASEIADVKSTLESLVEELGEGQSSLATSVSELNDVVADLQDAQTAIEEKLATLESDVKDALEQVAQAQADATSALTQIASLTESLNSLSEQVSDNESRIAETESKIAELEEYNTTTQSTLTDLEERLAAAEELLNSIYATTEDGTTISLADLQDIISSSEKALQEEIDALTADLEELAATVAEIQTNIQDMFGLLSAQLTSLVFVPEAYVDGVPSVVFSKMTYATIEVSDKNSDDEVWEETTNTITRSKDASATYLVNPANAKIDETVELSLYYEDTKNGTYISTSRAKASEDYALAIASYEYDGPHTNGTNSKLTVDLELTGDAATEENISTFALQATVTDDSDDEETESRVVTSDFAAIYQLEIDDIYIGEVYSKYDVHYRTEARNADDAAMIVYNSYTANSETYGPRYYTDDANYTDDADIQLKYSESLDLSTVVCVHYACEDGYNAELDLDDYGLTLVYEPVEKYIAGTAETDQSDFLKIDGSVITPMSAGGIEYNQASIGRAPIVRILLKDSDDNVVKVAFIKVKIVEEEEETPEPAGYEIVLESDAFDCSDGETLTSTYGDTDDILAKLGSNGFSKTYFFGNYTPTYLNGTDSTSESPIVGDDDYDEDNYVVLLGIDDYTTTTPIFEWHISATYMYEHSGEDIEYDITFTYGSASVTITLKTTLPDVAKELDLVATSQARSSYWYETYSYTMFNTSVPGASVGDDVFVNTFASKFIQNSDGVYTLDGNDVEVDFFFCSDMAKTLTIGGNEVTFTISDDGLSLYGELVDDTENNWGTQLIATIDNDSETAASPEIITYNDTDNELAELLLNSGEMEMYVLISMTGYYACNEDFAVTVKFNGDDHFKAMYLRPINIAGVSEGIFADGVADTHEGSQIDVTDLVVLTDWNGLTPDDFYDSYNFYTYYGISDDGETLNIEVDEDNITYIDMDGVTETSLTKDMTVSYDNQVLYYLNNGSTISGDNYFYLKVPVTVTYHWGELTQDILVKVVSKAVYDAQ